MKKNNKKGKLPTAPAQKGLEGQRPTSTQNQKVVLRISKLDFDGPWCFSKVSKEDFAKILKAFKGFESMKWSEIEGPRHHFVEIGKIINDAQRRLETIGLDDISSLFSFSIEGEPRVWGVRINEVFNVLWWDPEHKVCPSVKKHT
jgi:hypothetical protein